MIATGNDDFSQAIADRIGQFIVDSDANSARSQQTAIGPSEVGEPCERQLSYRLMDWPETNTSRDPIAAIIGTGFHLWMAEQFEARNHDGRYRIEEKVTVREGITDAVSLRGSADLFDRLSALNYDWKLVGQSSHDKYRRQGPGEKYRIQAHLYGLGQENAGQAPSRVVVVFVARYHELKVHVWSEPYDRQVALDALARLDRIRQRVADLDPERDPERWLLIPTTDKATCRFCPWLKPGSANLSVGCPGTQSANAGATFNSLIA